MKVLLLALFSLYFLSAYSQEKDRDLAKGNQAFKDKEYAAAEARYRISHAKNKQANASYNLGNSIYKQGHLAESKSKYLGAIKLAKTYEEKHLAYHNLGNVFMKEKEYQAAVEAYKNALRSNPNDEQTRYNYALAKKMLKDNPPPEGKDDKKNKKNQEQDQKDKQQQQDKQQQPKQKDQQQQDQRDNQKQEKKQANPRQGAIPKDRLQNLLDAVNNEEKKIQDKVNAKKVKGTPVETEKDW